jgi:hypothetical protein
LFSGVVSSTTAFFVVVVGGSAVASQRWLFVFGDVLVLRFADWIPDLLRFAGLRVSSLSPMRRGCCLISVSVVVFDFGLLVLSLSSLFGTRLFGSKGSLTFAAFFSQGVVGT